MKIIISNITKRITRCFRSRSEERTDSVNEVGTTDISVAEPVSEQKEEGAQEAATETEASCKIINVRTTKDMVQEEFRSLKETVADHDAGILSEDACKERIMSSYNKVSALFTSGSKGGTKIWLTYVKNASRCVTEPINELIECVSENNYEYRLKSLSAFPEQEIKKGRTDSSVVICKYIAAICQLILSNIDPNNSYCFFKLGQMAQESGDYVSARKWFERVIETEKPQFGVLQLAGCYEYEIKELLNSNRGSKRNNPAFQKRVEELRKNQIVSYEKWRKVLEDRIGATVEISDQLRDAYAFLLIAYARAERYCENYEKAYLLLQDVPEDFNNLHWLYSEKAMLYQSGLGKNRRYNLGKAVEFFELADKTARETAKTEERANQKCILIPLANTYFQMNRLTEASEVCDRVLKIDGNEKRILSLKKRISRMAS